MFALFVCCKTCLDAFRVHTVLCKKLLSFKYMHDFVRDVIFYIFRWARASMKKEAPLNFLTDPQEGKLTLKPIDMLMYGG